MFKPVSFNLIPTASFCNVLFFNREDAARAQLVTKSTVVDAILSSSSENRRREDDSDGNDEDEKDGDGAELTSGARKFKPLLNVLECVGLKAQAGTSVDREARGQPVAGSYII